MNCARKLIVVIGLAAILTGLFLAKGPDEPCLRLDDQDRVDSTPPALNGPAASVTFFVEPDQLLLRHSEEVNL